jgi:glycosyltransferase involved in cell wall biosynthesis
MLRVLMVTREAAEDRRYGLGRSLAPLIAPMAAAGAHVRYFCAEDIEPAAVQRRQQRMERWEDLPLVAGRPNRINLLRAWSERLHVGFEAARAARSEAYTHVHAHDPWLAAGVALGLRWHRARGVRWGLTQHGFGSYSQATHEDGLEQGPAAQAWLRRIERITTLHARWVTAPTQAGLAQLARDLALPRVPAHWHCVPHAKPPLAARTSTTREAARAALGWGHDELVVLAVGRLVPLKCFDRIVRACAAQQDPRVRLQLLGGGDAAPLQALAQRLGFGSRLHVTSTDDVTPFFHGADVYTSASSTESFGLANLEALCAGLPAICSAVGGVPEVMGDGAWLVPNDTDTLTRTLSALRTDEALRTHWAARALARAAGWPPPEDIARKYVAIYQAA